MRKYRNKNCNLDWLMEKVKRWFEENEFETQSEAADEIYLVQAKKTGGWRTVAAANRAFDITIEGTPDDFSVNITIGEWASNLASAGIAAVLTVGYSLLGTGVAAVWSKKTEGDLWAFIEHQINFGEKVKTPGQIAEAELRELVEDGLIDESQYQEKKAKLQTALTTETHSCEVKRKLEKLKAALESKLLTQEEYEAKKAAVSSEISSKTTQHLEKLKVALEEGILTKEEFEKKKSKLLNSLAD